jgi:hypothetical protein
MGLREKWSTVWRVALNILAALIGSPEPVIQPEPTDDGDRP